MGEIHIIEITFYSKKGATSSAGESLQLYYVCIVCCILQYKLSMHICVYLPCCSCILQYNYSDSFYFLRLAGS